MKLCPYSIISGALIGLMSFICLSCASGRMKLPSRGGDRKVAPTITLDSYHVPPPPPWRVRLISKDKGWEV